MKLCNLGSGIKAMILITKTLLPLPDNSSLKGIIHTKMYPIILGIFAPII
jgi:hypothetical protein